MSRYRLNRGFTLVETLLVVLLLSIVALVAQPSLNSSVDHAKLSAASDEVALALKYAQASAASSGRSCMVVFDESADTLAVKQMTSAADFMDGSLSEIDRAVAESVSFQLMGHPIKRGINYSLDFSEDTGLKGVDIYAANFGGGSSITFDALGAPSDAGAVWLRQGGREVKIEVDGLSGKVTVSGL